MLERVLRRAPFPTSLGVALSPSASAGAGKKAKTAGSSKGGKGAASPTSKRLAAAVAAAELATPNYQATALLVTEKDMKEFRRCTSKQVELSHASVAYGFKGQQGQAAWITTPKHTGIAAVSDAGAAANSEHPTVLVGLSRNRKQERVKQMAREFEDSRLGGSAAGEANTIPITQYRAAVTQAVRAAQTAGVETLRLELPDPSITIASTGDLFRPSTPLSPPEVAEKTACFAVTGAYQYKRLLTSADAGSADADSKKKSSGKKGGALQRVLIETPLREEVVTGGVIGAAVNDCRSLGNLREDEGTPEFYVAWAQRQIRSLKNPNLKVKKILKGSQIREAGLELLYSVGRGSVHTPYVMVLEYVGNRKSPLSTALVGKGVTFDCGGLNVKPYGSMETMHTDMMGAGVVLSTMRAAAELELPINLVGAVGLVENAIGPGSYHPGSILTSLSGQTVEVRNTDAEGRLVLADLFTYVLGGSSCNTPKSAALRFTRPPSTLIDLATLTGAIIISLGSTRAGCFSNDLSLSSSLMEAGTWSGEELWPCPIAAEHLTAVQGRIADLINTPPGREGGSCTAAGFLAHFVPPHIKWAHLDIAGPSDCGEKGKGYQPPGASGFGVQLLLDHLRRGVHQ